ncbi:hypothetical protein LguiA_034117 [Lonicera macranthoides]
MAFLQVVWVGDPVPTLHITTKSSKLVKLSSMATSFSLPSTLSYPNFTSSHHHHHNTSSLTPFCTLKLTISPKSLFTPLQTPCRRTITASATTFHGLAYVVGDNIDTDQIIPAEYLTLVYQLESEVRICEECRTGDVVTIELGVSLLINHTTGKEYKMKPIGDAGPVIEAGGNFAYARKTGMIPSQAA